MEHPGSPKVAGHSNREIRLISHSVNIFVIISQHFPLLLISKNSKAALHVSPTCSVSLYSTIRLIFCICLHRHCLKWKFQPVMRENGKTFLPHWWPLLKNVPFCVTRTKTHSSSELTNNDLLLTFYPVKAREEPYICTFHAMCFRSLRISYTT